MPLFPFRHTSLAFRKGWSVNTKTFQLLYGKRYTKYLFTCTIRLTKTGGRSIDQTCANLSGNGCILRKQRPLIHCVPHATLCSTKSMRMRILKTFCFPEGLLFTKQLFIRWPGKFVGFPKAARALLSTASLNSDGFCSICQYP